jgi:hypothetical protein
MEAWRLKMGPLRDYRPVVAGSHHFNEEQGPDLDPHLSDKMDPDPHLNETLDPDPE